MIIEYECSVPNRVSIWVGSLGYKEKLSDYIEMSYSINGDSSSNFLNDFPMADFDEDFTERFFFANSQLLLTTLSKFSYSDTFMDQVIQDINEIDIENQDSIFFVYGCDASFMKDFENTKMKLLGVYNYRKDD